MAITRWILPLAAISFFVVWFILFKRAKIKQPILAYLSTEKGSYVEITANETVIGSAKSSDVRIPSSSVPKKHSLLIRTGNCFKIIPLNGTLEVNGVATNIPTTVKIGDNISICGKRLYFDSPDDETYQKEIYSDDDFRIEKGNEYPSCGLLLTILSLFQALMCLQVSLRFQDDISYLFPIAFVGLIAVQWLLYCIHRFLIKTNYLAESIFFFLITIGLSVCYCCTPGSFSKQLVCLCLGFAGFFILWFILYRLKLTVKLRYIVAGVAVALLLINLIFGLSLNGARNWLVIGPISFQPSELVKVMFIFVGASVLSKSELIGKGFWMFLIFSGICMGLLALMIDFGAVSIFFITMIIILLMRLTNIWLIGGISVLSAVAAGGLILIYPHILDRFSAWTHVWDYAASTGYQQTRTLIASASGGLLGLGGGNGFLKNIIAADTDLVFGVITEEWGLIIAFCVALCFVALCLYALKISHYTTSVYYSIAVCAAAGMMLFQTSLNIFGSTDILPLTGVTIPLVSNGGSSMISGICMLAFFKAAEKPNDPITLTGRRYF